MCRDKSLQKICVLATLCVCKFQTMTTSGLLKLVIEIGLEEDEEQSRSMFRFYVYVYV